MQTASNRRQYYLANRERFLKYRHEYYLKNKEREAAKQKEYREKYKETIHAKNKIYNASEAGIARDKRYRKSEKGKRTRQRLNSKWAKRRSKNYKTTIQVGPMVVNFIRRKGLYYYVASCKGQQTISESYETLKTCRHAAKVYF